MDATRDDDVTPTVENLFSMLHWARIAAIVLQGADRADTLRSIDFLASHLPELIADRERLDYVLTYTTTLLKVAPVPSEETWMNPTRADIDEARKRTAEYLARAAHLSGERTDG